MIFVWTSLCTEGLLVCFECLNDVWSPTTQAAYIAKLFFSLTLENVRKYCRFGITFSAIHSRYTLRLFCFLNPCSIMFTSVYIGVVLSDPRLIIAVKYAPFNGMQKLPLYASDSRRSLVIVRTSCVSFVFFAPRFVLCVCSPNGRKMSRRCLGNDRSCVCNRA